MRSALLCTLVCTGLAAPAHAQAGAAKVAAPAPPSVTIPVQPEGWPLASRQVEEEKVAEYVKEISAKLVMSRRQTDPFGRNQDPDYRPPPPPASGADGGAAEQQPHRVPLSQIIPGIRVTMVLPARSAFYVGDRAFRQGDRFPVHAGDGVVVQVEVVSVTNAGIVFRDLATDEVATLPLNRAPEGVMPGAGSSVPQILVPHNPSAPLDLQQQGSPGNPSSR